jgi:DNA-binding NarL/FixJ family response regulator
MELDFDERQIAVGLCCGMAEKQMAEALGVSLNQIRHRTRKLLDRSGMADRMEFALVQNAAVREQMYPDVAAKATTA